MRPLWQTATGDMMPTSQACGLKVEGNNNGRMMLVTGAEMNDAMIDATISVMTAKVVDAAVMIAKVAAAHKTMVLVDLRGSGGSTTVCAV